MKQINFFYNWNNKLDCNAFPTLRLSQSYSIGEIYEVLLKKKIICTAQIVDIKEFYLHEINNYIAYLDSGYSPDECRKVLKTMYKNKNVDWDTQKIRMLLFVKIES